MPLKFPTLCEELANKLGGYTLWIGAGATKALTKGRAPSWPDLIKLLLGTRTPPPRWDHFDFPTQLEWLATQLGHETFRRALRTHIVDTVLDPDIDEAVVRDMAVIGARAGAIASFNVEAVSSVPVAMSPGGSFILRPYLREREPPIVWHSDGGITCKPVYFPHGLLDMYGECVFTKSEYKLHGISLAVGTAINLCLGGDLLILGMSLGDEYLRDAILQHRQWIRHIFWVTNHHEHVEWARVAKVHCVTAEHHEVWKGIADAHRKADTRNELPGYPPPRDLESRAVRGVATLQKRIRDEVPLELDKMANIYATNPNYSAGDLVRFARQCIDLGLLVPGIIANDARYLDFLTTNGP